MFKNIVTVTNIVFQNITVDFLVLSDLNLKALINDKHSYILTKNYTFIYFFKIWGKYGILKPISMFDVLNNTENDCK